MNLGFIILTQRAKKCEKSGNMMGFDSKSFGQRRSTGKALAFVFCDKDGVIFTNYTQQRKLMRGDYYCYLLTKFPTKIVEIRREKSSKGSLF
jgi:hypothetical protein